MIGHEYRNGTTAEVPHGRKVCIRHKASTGRNGRRLEAARAR